MSLIHARLAVALGFSTAAHVALAWMVSDHLVSVAPPAQRALTVSMTPAAPRAVLNSIAPRATAAIAPSIVRPVAPPVVPAIEEPDTVVAARMADQVELLDAPPVELRGPVRLVHARAAPAAKVAFAVAPSRVRLAKAVESPSAEKPLPPSLAPSPATSRRVAAAPRARPAPAPAPAVDGMPGAGRDPTSPRPVAGDPGADSRARPAAGNAPPEYPWTARLQGHQGRVILSVWVDADGGADRLAVLTSSGYSSLDRAAMEAVERWRFQPARRGGVDTGSMIYVPVVFRLNEGG